MKPIKLRDTIMGVAVCHDPYMIPIDLGVSWSNVKDTVSWSIKSLSAQ